MTLVQLINEVYAQGGTIFSDIVYNDMNFPGKATDYDFNSESFDIKDNEIRINSIFWEHVD